MAARTHAPDQRLRGHLGVTTSSPSAMAEHTDLPRCRPNTTVVTTGFVLTTVSLALIAVVLGAPPASAAVVVALVPAGCVDLRSHRLPDRLVLPAAGVGIAVVVLERLATSLAAGPHPSTPDVSTIGVLLGVVAAAGPLLLVHLASPGSLGFGDVKVAVVLGAGVALVDPLAGLVTVAVAGAIGALGGALARRRTIPFGPPLIIGAAAALTIAPWIVGR